MGGNAALSIRVLIADDNQHSREALRALIGLEPDLEVVGAAADAEEAINLVSQYAPDVAIVDVRMPGGGGKRAAEGIALASPNTIVIALSAYDDADVRGWGGRVHLQGRADRSAHRSDPARGSQAEGVRSTRGDPGRHSRA